MTATATKGGLKWGARVFLKTEQHSWDDAIFYEVPFTGHPDEAAILKALNGRFPRQSSWGALRWHSGWRVEAVDYERSIATVIDIVSRDELEIYRWFLRLFDDPNTKRMLFDSRQAAVFDDIEPPPANIQRKLKLPFKQFYLEFTDPLALANSEPGYNDMTRAFLITDAALPYTWGEITGELTQVVLFGTDLKDGNLSYFDRSWKVDLARGSALTTMAAYRSGEDVPDRIPLPHHLPDEEYWPAGVRFTREIWEQIKDVPSGKLPRNHLSLEMARPEELSWLEVSILNDTALISWCIAYMLAKSIVIVEEQLPRSERRRQLKEGKLPEPWHVVKVDPKMYIGRKPGEGEGTAHSYRYDVIGHLRFGRHKRGDGTYSETIEWVAPHQRGLANSIYIPKTSYFEKGRTIAEPMQRYFEGA